jgi:hypothetical protein
VNSSYLDVVLDTTGAESARLRAASFGGLDVVGLDAGDLELRRDVVDLDDLIVRL